MIFQDFKFT